MDDSKRPVSYQPTAGLSYDPTEAKYWDPEALHGEVVRTFEICHGCRLCFKFCDAFPTLFGLLDRVYDGDVTKVTAGETDRIADQCFQCKLCEVQCPYTVRDGHEYQLDFPRLIHRYEAVRARTKGMSLRDRVLGNPDQTAKLARASLGLANVMNRVQIFRWLLEKLLGIHRDKLLPDFASSTFEAWAARCVKGLQCCGMPAWEHGDLDSLRRQARNNLEILMPFVEKGAKVLAINPTCSMMMRREYPELLEGVSRDQSRRLAQAVMDPGEFLWSIREEARFNTEFASTPGGKVAYHAPCHLRAQAVGFKGRDLLRKIPGVTPEMTMECCGHNGTFAMTTGGFEASQRVGRKAFDGLKSTEAEVWATDCPLAALQFAQHAGRKPMHPMSILARAYREDGFPTPVVRDETRGDA